jgi:hypothetical protein
VGCVLIDLPACLPSPSSFKGRRFPATKETPFEAIAALASLLGTPVPNPAAQPQIDTGTCQNMNTACCRVMCNAVAANSESTHQRIRIQIDVGEQTRKIV